MGGVVSSIFGGGGYSAPEAPQIKSTPLPEETREPQSQMIRDEEKRRLRARRAMSGTILTSTLGTTGSSSGNGSGILGRTINGGQ